MQYIQELLSEKNNRITKGVDLNEGMEDFQEKDVFHNADLLSELIFSE